MVLNTTKMKKLKNPDGKSVCDSKNISGRVDLKDGPPTTNSFNDTFLSMGLHYMQNYCKSVVSPSSNLNQKILLEQNALLWPYLANINHPTNSFNELGLSKPVL